MQRVELKLQITSTLILIYSRVYLHVNSAIISIATESIFKFKNMIFQSSGLLTKDQKS